MTSKKSVAQHNNTCVYTCYVLPHILCRLGVTAEQRLQAFLLSIDEGTKKRKPTLPAHVPHSISLVDAFTYCVDIRAVPKKVDPLCVLQYLLMCVCVIIIIYLIIMVYNIIISPLYIHIIIR